MNVVWVCLLGWVDRSSAPALWGYRGDSQPALFKNLNYFNIWHLKILRGQRASLLATIIVFMLAYERADDRRAQMHTTKHTLRMKRSGVDKGEKTGEAVHQMIPLVCITELHYVNSRLMRPSNCVREIERHWRRQRQIKSIVGRQGDREKEGTLSIKSSRVSTWLITSLHDTSSTEEWRDGGRSWGKGRIIHYYQEGGMLLFLWEDTVRATRNTFGKRARHLHLNPRPYFKGNGEEKWEDLFLAFKALREVKVKWVKPEGSLL